MRERCLDVVAPQEAGSVPGTRTAMRVPRDACACRQGKIQRRTITAASCRSLRPRPTGPFYRQAPRRSRPTLPPDPRVPPGPVSRGASTLLNPRYYPYIRDEMEICGESMFWKLKAESYFHWEKINLIYPGSVHVVATMVLDLPTFDRESVVEYWSTISYEIDEIQYQIPVPPIQLTIAETIDSSCIKFLEENEHSAVLALKSTCNAESIVRLLKNNQDEYESWKKQFFHFLGTKAFERVCSDIFLVKEHLSLMYCLIEIQSITVNEMSVKIFARSVSQLNVILHLLRDEFSKDGHNVIVVEEIDDYVDAATALIRELELIRDKKSTLEIQEAKAITDLLIS
ncbi:uncharacterized protein [Linepithema humile]|uniref:uncharacterized protein isoform X2 n=1 Tax=Linepithema humile TaxID=83485 RepID=UPI00351EFCD1